MSIVNGYATLQQFKDDKRITSVDTVDDGVVEREITAASRLIDALTGRTFYARSETRHFNTPLNRFQELWFDDDLLAVTTLTNGDATTIASNQYVLLPANSPAKYMLKLKASASITWQPDANGDYDQAIALLGTWGFCDQAASDAKSAERIISSQSACLDIAVWKYLRRFGKETEALTQITAAGIITVPQGEMPKSAYKAIRGYIRSGPRGAP